MDLIKNVHNSCVFLSGFYVTTDYQHNYVTFLLPFIAFLAKSNVEIT